MFERVSGYFTPALEFDAADVIRRLRAENTLKIFAKVDTRQGSFHVKYERAKGFGPLFGRSLARKAFDLYMRLGNTLKCPAHLGWWECRGMGIIREWALITEFIENSASIYDYLLSANKSDVLEVSRQLGGLIGGLHSRDIASRAVDEENVIVQNANGQPAAWLLDLEHARGLTRDLLTKDIMDSLMLLGVAVNLTDASEVGAFLKGYSDAGGKSPIGDKVLRIAEDAFKNKWGFPSGRLKAIARDKKPLPRAMPMVAIDLR